MRLFIAADLSPDVRAHLAAHLEKVRHDAGVRWVSPESFHITLKFLGETDASRVKDIQSLVQRVSSRYSCFSLFLKSGGAFPSTKNPRVLWTGVSGDFECLKKISEEIEEELIPFGFPKENRSFRPHLTLGRVQGRDSAAVSRGRESSSSKSAGSSSTESSSTGSSVAVSEMTAVSQFCTLFSIYHSPLFEVNEIKLIRSTPHPSGSRYETLDSFSLRPR